MWHFHFQDVADMLKTPLSAHLAQLELCKNQTLPVIFFFFFLQISTFCSTVFFPWRGGRCQELPSSCDDTLQEQSEEIPETFIAEAQALASVSEGLCPLSNSCRQLSAG